MHTTGEAVQAGKRAHLQLREKAARCCRSSAAVLSALGAAELEEVESHRTTGHKNSVADLEYCRPLYVQQQWRLYALRWEYSRSLPTRACSGDVEHIRGLFEDIT
jgi:hypothetical protein